MISNVLVPLDGSILAEQALPTAVSLVRSRHGRLELLLVHGRRDHAWVEERPWAVAIAGERERYLADTARDWSETLGDPVTFRTARGNAASEICRRAKESGVDLIVMSTHARTGLDRMFGGSVADAVMRESRTPVLLLPPPPPGRRIRRKALHFKRILIPLDESPASREVFDIVGDLAERGSTEIILLRVVEPVRQASNAHSWGYVAGRVTPDPTRRLVDDAEEELAEDACTLEAQTTCDVYPHVVIDDHPGRAIVRFAERYDASLVAMTTHGRGASRLVLGSVADVVLKSARLPLLLLHPER